VSAVAPVLPRVAAWSVAPRRLLAAIVLAGAAVQSLFAQRLASPTVFPDEYLYSQLGRSLATTGHLDVRGVSPHFLPVLEPILTAPAWLLGGVGLAYRLIQVENALVFSLAAIPAYLIARRLGASSRLALGVAALTVLNPAALFTARVLSEPFAYPLALAVVAAALAVAERATLRSQAWLLVFAGLATFTRLQLAAVPLAAAVALLVVGRRELRRYALLVGVVAVCALGGLVVTLVHGFGYYKLAVHPTDVVTSARLLGVGLFLVVLGAGAALAPSGLVGIALAVAKPRTRVEHAFGLLTVLLAALVFAQCALWGDVTLVQERYLGYLLPLLALGFCLRLTRPRRHALAEAGVAAAVVCFAAAVPLSGYAIDDAHHLAPTLYAFLRVESAVGSPSGAAALFALGATVAVVVGAVAARFRRGALVAVAFSLVVAAALFAGASSWSAHIAADARSHYLPADEHWIDHLAGGDKTMLVVGQASTSPTLATLFWNPSVTRVVRAPGAFKVDWLNDPTTPVAADGTTALHGPVVVATNAAETVVLAGARRVASYGALTVWQPRGAVRLQSLMTNRLPDGRVLSEGSVRVWRGHFAGWIEVAVAEPAGQPKAVVSLQQGTTRSTVTVAPGKFGVVRLPACGAGPWRGGFTASPAQALAGSWLSPRLSVVRYVADPSACS
jgi:hypothetical protein